MSIYLTDRLITAASSYVPLTACCNWSAIHAYDVRHPCLMVQSLCLQDFMLLQLLPDMPIGYELGPACTEVITVQSMCHQSVLIVRHPV